MVASAGPGLRLRLRLGSERWGAVGWGGVGWGYETWPLRALAVAETRPQGPTGRVGAGPVAGSPPR